MLEDHIYIMISFPAFDISKFFQLWLNSQRQIKSEGKKIRIYCIGMKLCDTFCQTNIAMANIYPHLEKEVSLFARPL